MLTHHLLEKLCTELAEVRAEARVPVVRIDALHHPSFPFSCIA